jgi:hypothetical protein
MADLLDCCKTTLKENPRADHCSWCAEWLRRCGCCGELPQDCACPLDPDEEAPC